MPSLVERDKFLELIRALRDAAENEEVCAALDDLAATFQQRVPPPPLPMIRCRLISKILKRVPSEDVNALLSEVVAADPTNDKLRDFVEQTKKEFELS